MALGAWFWLMLHSLAYGVMGVVALAVVLVLLGWWIGLGWRSLYGAAVALPLALLAMAGAGLLVAKEAPVRAPATGLRVAHLNTYVFASSPKPALAFIEGSNADVVSLLEVAPVLKEQLGTISSTYPSIQQTTGPVPMVLLSRYPLTRAQAWTNRMVLYHVARPQTEGGAFYVLQLHPMSPASRQAAHHRNALLAALAEALPNLPRPLLLVGDFNTTPWDDALRPLNASIAMAGGWQAWLPTFPSVAPITPIDALWASEQWPKATVQRVRVEGADHLGLVLDFQR